MVATVMRFQTIEILTHVHHRKQAILVWSACTYTANILNHHHFGILLLRHWLAQMHGRIVFVSNSLRSSLNLGRHKGRLHKANQFTCFLEVCQLELNTGNHKLQFYGFLLGLVSIWVSWWWSGWWKTCGETKHVKDINYELVWMKDSLQSELVL